MFADPLKILKTFNLRENMIVADLGAGSGFYTIPTARIVANGKVYAIEIQKDFLTTIKNNAKEAHLNNIECFVGNIEKKGGTKLKDEIIDGVLASNIFFQVKDKEGFIEEAKRILKKGGRLLLVDWSDNLSNFGLRSDQIIPKNEARLMFEEKGFVWERDVDAGSHHYGIIFSKI